MMPDAPSTHMIHIVVPLNPHGSYIYVMPPQLIVTMPPQPHDIPYTTYIWWEFSLQLLGQVHLAVIYNYWH